MKKFHVKLNRVLAVTLSALMVCLSLPGDHVLADTVSQGDAPGAVTENTLPNGTTGGNGAEDAPVNALPEGASVFASNTEARDASPYLFGYDGETATEGVLGLDRGDYNSKTGALKVTATPFDGEIPLTTAVTSGTVVFDVEFCPMGKCQESAVFVNSKGETLFAVCADSAAKKVFLCSEPAGTELVSLGSYTDNSWCRVRTEIYLDDSKDGKLQFKVSAIDSARNTYEYDPETIHTVTQEELIAAGGTNGTVGAVDGSADHPFDLAKVTVHYKGTAGRAFGDMFLYNISNVTLKTQPGAQTPGTDFTPGDDAAFEVTYVGGATQEVKLATLALGVDYTAEKNEDGKYVLGFAGKELVTDVDVPAAIVTGIQIKSAPAKTNYEVGEALDTTGLVVEAVKSDNTVEPLNADAYTVSAVDTSTAGYKDVTVTYNENQEFTASFKIKVVDNSVKMQPIFSYTGDAASLDELELGGETTKVELSTTAAVGNDTQHLSFTEAGTVTKSWDALSSGIVKINAEFYENAGNAYFRICDADGKVLINIAQFPSKGNINLYDGQDTSGTPSTIVAKKNQWIRLETEIDLTASNADQKLKFTTNVLYKAAYTDEEWKLGGTVTAANYVDVFGCENGCATKELAEFSVGSIAIQGSKEGVAFDNIEVLVPAAAESQSFSYIDEEDITTLEIDAPVGFLEVVSDAIGSNETNKLKINGESATKMLNKPISTGKVTFTTVGYHNGKILGIKILNSEGNALVNYAQQSSGNLNMYKGNAITGGGNTINLASSDNVKNKWIKVETTIDLDESNKLGVLQFEMNVSYKGKYTDEEWIPVKTYTQQETYVGAASNASANGCATEGITSFDIGGIQFGSQQGDTYVDDILFDDGNGISGIVTITKKVLKSIAITTEAATKEFPQDGKISTEGLVLTGTYDVTYSDGKKEEKTYKITKYDVECDTSKIADSVPVTIKVTDNGAEFTTSYNVKIVAKPDGSYVTFSYTDEAGVAHTGFDGSKISVAGGDVSGNTSNKIKLDKGTSTMTLANTCTTGTVHFETEFLTTATSKASLFLRILNSEGKPMVDIAQYGSGNLNLYIDKQTSGTDGAMAGTFGGLPVKQWAKLSVDIDLEETKAQGHLVFDAIVWTKADYAGDWTVHAEFDENLYLNSKTAPTTTGSASTNATVLDVAGIELQNAGGTNYYDNMFFEAIRGDVKKELVALRIESPAEKTDYTVGDGLNRAGLVLMGVYKYTFPNGDVKEREAEVTKYDVSFDNTQPGESVPVILTAGGLTVSYNVLVRPNTSLDDVEEYLVGYINNKLVNLDGNRVIHINKRQVRLPIETAKGEGLSWEIASGNADVTENILTVVPSAEEKTRVELKATLSTTNNDGDPVSFSKTIVCEVPREAGDKVDDSLANDESVKYAVTTLFERGLFEGQANLADVEAVMASLDREITTEEVAVILVNLFGIDTTYTDTKVSRGDVEDDAWYSKYVKAAFQLSVETRDSREGKENYGIGKGISKDNLLYMIDRIVHIDQTSLPSDYADRMFE